MHRYLILYQMVNILITFYSVIILIKYTSIIHMENNYIKINPINLIIFYLKSSHLLNCFNLDLKRLWFMFLSKKE